MSFIETFPYARIGESIRRFIDVENSMDIVFNEIIIRVKNVVIIPVGSDQMLCYHMVVVLEVIGTGTGAIV